MRAPALSAMLLASAVAQGQTPSLITPDRLTLLATPAYDGRHPDAPALRGGPPPNDECTGAVIHPLSAGGTVEITGDNTGATDTEGWGNPNAWEAFDLDACASVTVKYCGTTPVFEIVYSILIIGCDPFLSDVQRTDTASCADGNVEILYADLQPGIYYIPVLSLPGICEGPYKITCVAVPCDVPPLNDICAAADTLAVHVACSPDSATVGGNALAAVTTTGPDCAAAGTQFQDVWYTFNSGDNMQVTITLDPITIADMGIEVTDSCGGDLIYCAPSDTAHTMAVNPFTDYWVRVFTNNAFGAGGSFTICVAGELTTGVTTTNDPDWMIAPNPTDGIITLVHPALSVTARIELFDPAGRCLLDRTVGPHDGTTHSFDLRSTAAPGMMLLRITTPEARITRHVVLR